MHITLLAFLYRKTQQEDVIDVFKEYRFMKAINDKSLHLCMHARINKLTILRVLFHTTTTNTTATNAKTTTAM